MKTNPHIYALLGFCFYATLRIFLERTLTNILKSNNELYILHSVLSSDITEVMEY